MSGSRRPLEELSTSPREDSRVAWPAVRAVRWQDRDLLLTSSAYEGVMALWDLDRPVGPELGREERISDVCSAKSAESDEGVDVGGQSPPTVPPAVLGSSAGLVRST